MKKIVSESPKKSLNKPILKKSKNRKDDCNSCHDSEKSGHPDHRVNLPRLKRVEGQIRGISDMISSDRYCVDILIQMRAAVAALRSIEMEVFETHVRNCVKDAVGSKDAARAEEKLNELVKLILKRT